MQAAGRWAAARFEERARREAVTPSKDWPGSWVEWPEVREHIKPPPDCLTAREQVMEAFGRELRRSGLAAVLAGRLSAAEWVAGHKRPEKAPEAVEVLRPGRRTVAVKGAGVVELIQHKARRGRHGVKPPYWVVVLALEHGEAPTEAAAVHKLRKRLQALLRALPGTDEGADDAT